MLFAEVLRKVIKISSVTHLNNMFHSLCVLSLFTIVIVITTYNANINGRQYVESEKTTEYNGRQYFRL